MFYFPQYFQAHEVVPQAVYKAVGEGAWQLMDSRTLISIDRLRSRYGPMTINNYYWGGEREWSGLRTQDSPYYSRFSQHTFGRACDCLFRDITAEEVRQDIIEWNTAGRPDETDHTFEFITSLELGVSWLHFDTRNVKTLMTYRPGT